MGYQLYRHVLDHAPADLTPSERFVLAVIADDANDTTRTGYPGMDVICHRTGMTPGTVQKALWRLARRGIDVRVALGVDSRGRQVYAVKGKRTTYRIPRLPERDDLPSPMARPQSGHSEERPDSDLPKEAVWPDSDPTMARSQSDMARPQSGPSPQVPSESPHIGDDDTAPSDGLFDEPPKTEKPKKTKKATPAPEHFDIDDRMRQWAKDRVPDVDIEFETEQFLDRHRSKGSTFSDWTSAWRTWMRNSRKFAEERQQRQGKQGPLRVVGGTRSEVPDSDYWANITDEELRNVL